MKCPYCGNEMVDGVIQSSQEIAWKKERKTISRAMFYEGSVVLSKLNFLRGSAVKAHNCRECKKIVVDYNNDACDLNIKK